MFLLKEKKIIKLFGPADSFNLYAVGNILDIGPRGHHSFCGQRDSHWSQVQLTAPPEEIRRDFPRFFDASYLECTVEAGEMLFIPNGWWHEVTSYGVHIALNIWTDRMD